MARKKHAVPSLHLTKGKVVRLAVFAILTAAGFFLSAHLPAMRSFGWGYFFGMVGMAVLIG